MFWIEDSNFYYLLQRQMCYHYTNPKYWHVSKDSNPDQWIWSPLCYQLQSLTCIKADDNGIEPSPRINVGYISSVVQRTNICLPSLLNCESSQIRTDSGKSQRVYNPSQLSNFGVLPYYIYCGEKRTRPPIVLPIPSFQD